MVDVDRRMIGLNKAHVAGLRRLSARASAPTTSTTTISHTTLQSFTTLSATVKTHLLNSNIQLLPGLTDFEFSKLEAEFNFIFPPDLRAVLSSFLPSGPGFPDWRSKSSLKQTLTFPIAAASIHILKNTLWSKSWGLKPSNPHSALKIARAELKRAPLLIPIFNHCYIPCNPSIAGNPIFFVDENKIFICGFDLYDFFQRETLFSTQSPEPVRKQRLTASSSPPSTSSSSASSSNASRSSLDVRTPRWIEFWSEAAVELKRRNSRKSDCSASSASCNTFKSVKPEWIDEYISTQISQVLLKAGWKQNDVEEIVDVSASDMFETEDLLLDHQSVLDALLVKADRFSDSLRKGGWSSEEVSEVLGFEVEERRKRPAVKMSPELVEKIGKLVESVGRYLEFEISQEQIQTADSNAFGSNTNHVRIIRCFRTVQTQGR